MATAAQRRTAERLLELSPGTFAQRAGIRLDDKPSPLYQLLVLATLLSARIGNQVAVDAARELFEAGFRTPRAMLEASWQERVDALGRGHYRRYDERTATMLGDGAHRVLDTFGGDLRRLHERADGVRGVEQALQDFKGIGPTGAAIFCREVQGVWPDLAPYLDERALRGAGALGLPEEPDALAGLVPEPDLPGFAAALVEATLDKKLAEQVRAG